MSKLTMLIGLPRCGKTTEAGKYEGKAAIVSADQFRQLIYGQRFYKDGESYVWAVRNTCFKALLQQGIDIVIDETNITKESRAAAIKLAKSYGYRVEGIFFDTDPRTCKRRAIDTKQEDLLPIIDKMNDQLEPPMLSEGFSCLHMWTRIGNYILMEG